MRRSSVQIRAARLTFLFLSQRRPKSGRLFSVRGRDGARASRSEIISVDFADEPTYLVGSGPSQGGSTDLALPGPTRTHARNDSHVFVSHSSKDDPFFKELRRALDSLNTPVWADSRELAGGSELEAEVERAIDTARSFVSVLSLHAINSPWVRREG